MTGADGMVFVVDSNDHERLEESTELLHGTLKDMDVPNHCAILVIANKQDLEGHMSAEHIYEKMKLHTITDRPVCE